MGCWGPRVCCRKTKYQVFPSDPFESFKWPFQGLSELPFVRRVTWKDVGTVVGGCLLGFFVWVKKTLQSVQFFPLFNSFINHLRVFTVLIWHKSGRISRPNIYERLLTIPTKLQGRDLGWSIPSRPSNSATVSPFGGGGTNKILKHTSL